MASDTSPGAPGSLRVRSQGGRGRARARRAAAANRESRAARMHAHSLSDVRASEDPHGPGRAARAPYVGGATLRCARCEGCRREVDAGVGVAPARGPCVQCSLHLQVATGRASRERCSGVPRMRAKAKTTWAPPRARAVGYSAGAIVVLHLARGLRRLTISPCASRPSDRLTVRPCAFDVPFCHGTREVWAFRLCVGPVPADRWRPWAHPSTDKQLPIDIIVQEEQARARGATLGTHRKRMPPPSEL